MSGVLPLVGVSTDKDLFKDLSSSLGIRSSEMSTLVLVQVLGAQSI